jgi:uncharacterized protein (TIGR04222 family)
VNPFDLKGPEFLSLYLVVLAVALLAAYLARQSFRQPTDAPPAEALDLHPYEVAYLAGGATRAINAVIAGLVHRGLVCVNVAERTLSAQPSSTTPRLAVEKAAYDHVLARPNLPIRELHSALASTVTDLGDRSRALGLLVTEERAALGRLLPTLLVLGVAGFGAIKILVGMGRQRPVGFLTVLCIGTVVVAFAGFARRLHRSWRGDLALEQFKVRNAALEYAVPRNVAQVTADDLALAVGLFGAGVLASGPLADLKTALTPPAGSSSCGSGSGCSSGCGGGGGCGGGCGGGGCGGCGS